MDAISQKTFWNLFQRMEIALLWFKFPSRVLLKVYLETEASHYLNPWRAGFLTHLCDELNCVLTENFVHAIYRLK